MYYWTMTEPLHGLLNNDWTTTCTTEQWLNHYMYYWTMTESLHVLLNNDWTSTCTPDQWLNPSLYYWSVTEPLHVLLISDSAPLCTTDHWMNHSIYHWTKNEGTSGAEEMCPFVFSPVLFVHSTDLCDGVDGDCKLPHILCKLFPNHHLRLKTQFRLQTINNNRKCWGNTAECMLLLPLWQNSV